MTDRKLRLRDSTLLAQEFVVVGESPDPQEIFIDHPALAKHPSRRLIAVYTLFWREASRKYPSEFPRPEKSRGMRSLILTSDDNGATWTRRAAFAVGIPTPFVVGETLYLVGVESHPGSIVISRSDDEGICWRQPTLLFDGSYAASAPVPLLLHNDKIYKAWDYWDAQTGYCVQVSVGDISQDLTDPASWRLSNRLPYPGDPSMMNFSSYELTRSRNRWLEGNTVLMQDKIRVILRVRSDGATNVGAVCTLSDDSEGLRLDFDWFTPLPGGSTSKQHILYDEVSDLYWMAANQPTDHLQDPRPLHAHGFKGPPSNERRILNLYYSLDALNWFQAGTIAMSRNPLESFMYPFLLMDGDDLLVLSRTSLGAKNQHDANLTTFHRVRDFRELALDIHPVL